MMIASTLAIPKTVVLRILSEDLEKGKLCARFVPHFLRRDQMDDRVMIDDNNFKTRSSPAMTENLWKFTFLMLKIAVEGLNIGWNLRHSDWPAENHTFGRHVTRQEKSKKKHWAVYLFEWFLFCTVNRKFLYLASFWCIFIPNPVTFRPHSAYVRIWLVLYLSNDSVTSFSWIVILLLLTNILLLLLLLLLKVIRFSSSLGSLKFIGPQFGSLGPSIDRN